MKLRILLVNPWIYDFAAANLWSRPLGLLKVAECLSRYEVEFSLIDCTDVSIKEGRTVGKYPKERVDKPECLKQVPRIFGRYGITIEDFKLKLSKAAPFDIVFVTSIMSWWYPGVQKVIELIRGEYKGLPVVLGGIYPTLWHRHACNTSGADFVHCGAVGEDIRAALNTFGFRLKKKSEVSSPYYRLGLYAGHSFAPVMTGTGCPFACPYCASRVLQKDFCRKTADEVVDEIKELGKKGVRDFAFYDDALLFDAGKHIQPILAQIVSCDIKARFHCPNGLHARFIDDELARLMRDSGFTTLRLGLETVDRKRQIGTGDKVTCEDLARAVGHLKRHGFTKKEIGVYLMYGLPGQTFNEVREGVAFLISLGVNVHLSEFSPIPGTECWKELRDKGIVKEDMDPLLTNNTVFSYLFSGYDSHEVDELKLKVKNHNMS